VGQEKSGTFFEHLDLIERHVPSAHLFVPDHNYVCEHIQHRPTTGAPYGKDTDYGATVLLALDERHHLVLNIPVSSRMSDFILAPSTTDLIGLSRILATLPTLLSSRHENTLMPIELAHSIASLSTYPSAQVLRLLAESAIRKQNRHADHLSINPTICRTQKTAKSATARKVSSGILVLSPPTNERTTPI
jgi:hypothetical protein